MVTPELRSSSQRYAAWLEARKQDDRKDDAAKLAKAGAEVKGAKAKKDWTEDSSGNRSRKAGRPVKVLVVELLRVLKGHYGKAVLAVTTLTVVTLLGLLLPLATKIAFDYILTDNPGPKGLKAVWPAWLPVLPESRVALLWWLGAGMVGLTLLTAAIGTVGRYQMTRLGQIARATVRRRLFKHLLTLPLHRIQGLKSGGVSSLLREDAGSVGDMLFSVIYNPLRAIITFAGGLAAMAMLDWRMVVGGVLMVPAVYFTHRTWIGRIRPVHRSVKQDRQNSDAHATETFSGIRVVRSFGGHYAESRRFVVATHLMARKDMLIWFWSRYIETAWIILIPAASAAVMVYGGSRVLAGTLTIGDVAAFTAYLLMLLGPMEVLVSTASSLQNSLAAWDRVLDAMGEKSELSDERAAAGAGNAGLRSIAKESSAGAVRIEGLSFKYPGHEKVVLAEINLEVKPGTMVALVGPSGSGKTTLCNLIARFYDPVAGRIVVDGHDLRTIEPESYRRLLGIVEQEVFLFDGSVAENIAYGNPKATRGDVEAAAQQANAAGFIGQLEKGYETLIGERGVRLSGGQKQRLAIARAILADPRILILDEATSNLDSESERLIQRSLAKLMKGRTSFVIAHRLSTVRNADMIVVIENGRILETGTHGELTTRGGRYAAMLKAQIDPLAVTEDEPGMLA